MPMFNVLLLKTLHFRLYDLRVTLVGHAVTQLNHGILPNNRSLYGGPGMSLESCMLSPTAG